MIPDSPPFDCEMLRPEDYVSVPDPRTKNFVEIDKISGRKLQISIDLQHDDISKFSLNADAPKDIVIKFETAKNLYLYAWFVYRFYNIADQQVFACLEMALRERLAEYFPLPREY